MNRFTRVFLFFLLVVLVGGVLFFTYFGGQPLSVDNLSDRASEVVENVDRQTITPAEPLRGPTTEAVNAQLTVDGIVAETNRHRQRYNLAPLSLNSALSEAARIKVDDMFARQYFAHESPTGEGPADLADEVGYDYLMVGENLALGNYENDTVLVQAWMDSPGHRENILHTKYDEIGIAIKEGTYEGNTVWMAVQEFGRPASDCTRPDEDLQAQIDANEAELDELERELQVKREQMESARPGRQRAEAREEYNELVSQYNALLEETKQLIADYNVQVQEYNFCLQQ